MKKLFAILLACLLFPTAAFCDTTTPHYSFAQPSIGNTTNWGLSNNANFAALDNDLWAVSGGLTSTVNAPVASATLALTNPVAAWQNVSFTVSGRSLLLPPMNASNSMVVGGVLAVRNAGTNAFSIMAQDGTTSIVSTLATGQIVYLTLSSGSTANGSFIVAGPYAVGGSTVVLGLGPGATNPQSSGDATTGFYSPASGSVAASISGSQRFLVNSSGASVAGNVALSNALSLTATSASSGLVSGVHSPAANAIALTTTGVDRLTVANGATVGSPTGGDKGAGTINAGGSYTNGSPLFGSVTVQTFCASGCTTTCTTTCTYTPNSHLLYGIAEIVGGGGGGGGVSNATGGPGAAAGYAKALLNAAQIGSSQSITMGSAGAGGSSGGGSGGTGGTTSFGSVVSCTGGTGGDASGGGGNAGGACTVSTGTALLNLAGQGGSSTSSIMTALVGASGPVGFGGVGGNRGGSESGGAATGFGAGGGGATSAGSAAGGNGSDGYISIMEVNSQ